MLFRSGMNFRDVLLVLKPELFPEHKGDVGFDCSGTVVAVGGSVKQFRVGDEVIAICPGGAYGSHVIVTELSVARKPKALAFEDGAAIPVACLTASWCLERIACVKGGDTVLVHAAAGGVGLAALEIVRRAGAVAIATVGKREKREYLTREMGIPESQIGRASCRERV